MAAPFQQLAHRMADAAITFLYDFAVRAFEIAMLEALQPSDAAAAADLSAGFGWPHRSQDWAMFLKLGRGIGWREHGALMGTAMFFPLDAEHGTIGLVQVSPRLQGNGLGRRLMEAALALGAGKNIMLHATAEGAGLYARLGFVPRGVVQQWQGITSGQGRGMRRATSDDLAELCAIDRAATGLDRTPLLRALFGASETNLSGPPGAVTGYAMRRSFGRGNLIGPIVASDDEEAASLLASLQTDGFVRVDIPMDKSKLATTLANAGLASVDDVRVMVHGRWPRAEQLFALSSQAMG